jgi:hypothetical protein
VKKLFEEILLEYRCKVKHEWQKKRDFGEDLKKRACKKNDGSTSKKHQKASPFLAASPDRLLILAKVSESN